MKTQTAEGCNEFFDGDRNILCKDLFAQAIKNSSSSLLGTQQTFGEVLFGNMRSESLESSLFKEDSLVQLFLFVAAGSNDSTDFSGIVVIPENYDDQKFQYLKVYYLDGTEGFLNSDVEPNRNYLVISENERGGKPKLIESGQVIKSAIKSMKITKASFTSMDAKRKVEDCALGEPEVRLSMLYVTSGMAASSSFMYPNGWIGGTWLKPTVTWNNTLIDLPLWDNSTQSIERKLIWREEDGSTVEKDETFTWTNPLTGITLTTTRKIPASDKQQDIAASYIHFADVSGEYNWGLIKFNIQF